MARSYRHLDPRDVTVVRGIPVTTVARTLVDLADVLTPHQLAKVIDEADYLGLFDLTETYEAMQRANGRHNLGVLNRAIGLYIGGSAGTKSRNEDAFLALLRLAGLPEPLVNRRRRGRRGRLRVARPFAGGRGRRAGAIDRPTARRTDARKARALTAAGYTVLRVTDVDLTAAHGRDRRLRPLLG